MSFPWEGKIQVFTYENFLMAERETERNRDVAWQFVSDGCQRNRVYRIVHTSVENVSLIAYSTETTGFMWH